MSEFRKSGPAGPGRGHTIRCTAIGCERKPDARGMCSTHYMRWLRTAGREQKIVQADLDGYKAGRVNRHHEKKTYGTSAEYIAWLAGWRRGQEMRRGRIAA